MPPGFGPSVAPEIETDFDVHNSTVEFETSAEAVSELMPDGRRACRSGRASPSPTAA